MIDYVNIHDFPCKTLRWTVTGDTPHLHHAADWGYVKVTETDREILRAFGDTGEHYVHELLLTQTLGEIDTAILRVKRAFNYNGPSAKAADINTLESFRKHLKKQLDKVQRRIAEELNV